MKYKVIADFVMNGVTYKKDSVIELDHVHANLKSIQKNIVKVDKNESVSAPAPIKEKPVEAPKEPETPSVEPQKEPETPPVTSETTPGEQGAPTGQVGQTTPETPPQA